MPHEDAPASEQSQEQGFRLYRQDDNGYIFPMNTYDTAETAELARAEFESRAHKQFYFVRPASADGREDNQPTPTN